MNAVDTAMTESGMVGRHRRGGEDARDAAESRYGQLQLALGVVAILAAAVLVIVGALNRSLQADVAAGQARIANAQAAANVNNTLIRLLAKAAAEKGDDKIRDLLSRNGISFRQTPGDAAPVAPAQPQ